MIKRTAVTVMGLVVALAMIGCESTSDTADRAGSKVEDRANQEVDKSVDNALDSALDR